MKGEKEIIREKLIEVEVVREKVIEVERDRKEGGREREKYEC